VSDENVPISDGPPRMSDDELRAFVDDYVSGRIWVMQSAQREEDMALPFLVLQLSGLPDGWKAENVGTVWEYMSNAGPRSVNGMPMFFSCHFMHAEDWQRVLKAVTAERDKRSNIEV